MDLLWPDDVKVPTGRDGTLARLGGNQLYFYSRSLAQDRPNLFSENRPAITRHILDNAGSKPVELMTHNIDAIIRRQPFSVRTKFERLLSALARMTDFQVDTVDLTQGEGNSAPFVLAREAGLIDTQELLTLLKHAHAQRLVALSLYHGGARVETTIPGLIHVEESARSNGAARTAFVAMWFADEMTAPYSDGVAPAIEANGWEAVRIDRSEHNNKIDDEIISQIRRSHFVVADFSCGEDGARGGVYFEAGYAMALGKPVIWMVRQADLPRVHFDTRQFNHIVWSDPGELREKLTNRISATIGRFGD